MAVQEPRRISEDLLAINIEPQFRASQEVAPKTLTPAGDLTTTTVTDAAITGSIVGAYLIPEDGAARDQVRQVISLSSTTATIDTAWNSTANVTSIRVWRPAEVPLRGTGTGGTTWLICSDWTNKSDASGTALTNAAYSTAAYHVWGVGGNNAGKASNLTAFSFSTGSYVFGDAFTQTVEDDLHFLRRTLRPEAPPEITIEKTAIDRGIVGYSDAAPSVMGTNTGTCNFELPVRGIVTAGSDGAVASRPLELSDLMTGMFTQSLDTGDTALSATNNTVTVSTAGSRFNTGGFILVNTGEVGHIKSIAGDVLTVGTDQITEGDVQGSSASTVYSSAWYQRRNTGFPTYTLDYYRGGLFRQVMHGCSPAITIAVDRDEIVRFGFNFQAGEAWEYNRTRPVLKGATLPIDILDTSNPYDAKGSRCLLDGVNVLLTALTVDMGYTPTMRPSLSTPNQMDGHTVTTAPVTGSFTILSDEDDRSSFEDICDRMNRGAFIDFLYQKGTSAGDTFALAVPQLQITGSPVSYNEGQAVYTCTWRAVLPQVVSGNSFDAALPAFAFGWL